MEEEMSSEETNRPSQPLKRTASNSQGHCATEKETTLTGNISNNYEIENLSMFSDNAQCCCCSLLEAMPLPGPTWSTTAPSVLAEPPSVAPNVEDSVELVWGENQASSYTWWLGFLESLDNGNMTSEKLKLDHSFVENNFVMENYHEVHGYESPNFVVDAIDLSCCPDDWLMIPTTEKD